MGFGSYDESDQEKRNIDTDSHKTGVRTHENEYDGNLTFEMDTNQDDLFARLEQMKSEDEDS